MARFETNPRLLASAKAYYRTHPKEFINHWVETYDPRNAGTKKPTRMPLIMFPRQAEMVDFVYGCLEDDANGLEEKCRDMGATWVCCAISVHLWLFWEGAAIGWGSRKAELVDKRGDPKCIFEKIRDVIRNLPACFLPRGFDPRMHMVHMSVLNPETGASIIGEVGDNIGRGGRTRVYFKDEALTLGAKVLTPDGWKTMADMAVGSTVTGPMGDTRRVIGVNECGVHDVYRVRFSDGASVRCSPNHLWTVWSGGAANAWRTLRTTEIAASLPRLYRLPWCAMLPHLARDIVAVERDGREPVRCISVDAGDGLYLTDDYVVTHNSSHYERPENIEAALSENTRTQIDISSVNGPNNVFHRKREAGEEWAPGKQIPQGVTRVFIMDVFDHPEKTKAWYEMRKKEMTNQGLGHLFAQEVDRDYLAAVSGVIIPADWVRSCIDAHIKLKLPVSDSWTASLDVADDSLTGDRNALTLRQGIVLRSADEWGGVDPGVTANRAKNICEVLSPIDVQYDCIGVGAGVKSETNRLIREKKMPKGVRFIQWNAGMKPLHPERRVVEHDKQSPKNEDFYKNLKAQGWWELRMRAYRTHMAVTQGQKYDADTLFSIDSKMRLFHTVLKELSQPIADKDPNGKLIVDKTPEGTKSPNIGDSVMMLYFPMPGPMVVSTEALNASRRR